MSSPPSLPVECYYTVVGDELSFRLVTPGDRSDMGALPLVRPCRHRVVGTLAPEADGAPPVNVCDGHRALAQDARAAQRERYLLLPTRRPSAAPPVPPTPGGGPQAAG